jgi:threonine dehydrogenase-like Zn-dependent dehydrogenase
MKTILIQLDTDPHPSSFDRVVAVDVGVEELFSYGGVSPDNVESLVHGAMFTRGPSDLQNTAIFIGGSDVAAGEALLVKVQSVFFGPMRVSVMMDSNGSNTTAAAAVLAAAKHLSLPETEALVLGGTGPVGLLAAQLLSMEGVHVRLASRSRDRAAAACERIASRITDAKLTPCASDDVEAMTGVQLIIAAGAAGVQILSTTQRSAIDGLQVAIDLNAVHPAGLEGIEVFDKAVEKDGHVCYGAIGVGGTKMRIHKAAIRRLFESNDQTLDTEAIYRLGQSL